jgi:hypothetical protein
LQCFGLVSGLYWTAGRADIDFFNSLMNPYSITYAERPAEHCLPRALRGQRVIKMLKIERKAPKIEAAEQVRAK